MRIARFWFWNVVMPLAAAFVVGAWIDAAWAQAAIAPGTTYQLQPDGSWSTVDPGTVAVSWIVNNQKLAAAIITFFGGRLVLEIVSGAMKKYGITKDSPGMSMIVPLLRAVSIDLTPPDAVVVANAQKIAGPAAIPDSVVAAVKANGNGTTH
jgi:hypothetical protein